MIQDDALLERVGKGDADALALLHQRHAKRFFAYFWRRCGNKHSAEDLTQELFLKIWKTTAVYEERGKPLSYLYITAQRLHLDWMKKKKPILLEKVDASHGGQTKAEEPEEEPGLEIRNAIDDLSPDIRDTFILSRYENLTYPQIAETLSVSVKTVEARISKALQILRKKLEHHLT